MGRKKRPLRSTDEVKDGDVIYAKAKFPRKKVMKIDQGKRVRSPGRLTENNTRRGAKDLDRQRSKSFDSLLTSPPHGIEISFPFVKKPSNFVTSTRKKKVN